MRPAWLLGLLCLLCLACTGAETRATASSSPGETSSRPSPAAQAELAALGYYSDDQAARMPPRAPDRQPRDGAELVGRELSEWRLSDWVNGPAPLSLAELRGRVVVIRFWTVGCPFCEKSMPALQKLADEFAGRPVTFIGAFHEKPVGSIPDMEKPLEVARSWGIRFPLAFDKDWRTLRAWWLDGHPRNATSVTFVLGRDGRVAHVHPGPEYFPSEDPADADENADFVALRAAVQAAVLGRITE
jgi:thiol-disulfide isomerase/thioredoxin